MLGYAAGKVPLCTIVYLPVPGVSLAQMAQPPVMEVSRVNHKGRFNQKYICFNSGPKGLWPPHTPGVHDKRKRTHSYVRIKLNK